MWAGDVEGGGAGDYGGARRTMRWGDGKVKVTTE